ncbi:hypothetical protein [Bailinhaonella thermotolerans]|uniref:hypothetical protein n=1 Tax=Bailinhaonella thermotolerans TaxID=1070861 RepID=UPI00192A5B36|nr:hypothetical protein [Bailinhaonella thermotolerans]
MAPGGHLGVLTGRAARHTTWPCLDAWFARTDDAPRRARDREPDPDPGHDRAAGGAGVS